MMIIDMLVPKYTVETIISFEQASYVFSEDIGVGRVCLERSGYIQEQNDIQVIGGMYVIVWLMSLNVFYKLLTEICMLLALT